MRCRKVLYREFWGARKREEVLAAIVADDPDVDAGYEALSPSSDNRFRLRSGVVNATYAAWPEVVSLSVVEPVNGLMEKRGGALIDDDRAALERRMRAFFDTSRTLEQVAPEIGALAAGRARAPARATREKALAEGAYDSTCVQRYWLRPFETPWAYVTGIRPIWNEPRPALQHLKVDSGGFLVTRPQATASPEGFVTSWTPLIGDNDALRGHAYYLPAMENLSGTTRPNLSAAIGQWLEDVGLVRDAESAQLVWRHALAITHSPEYLGANAEGIRQGWPRIPLPGDIELLCASASLGSRLVALLDPATPVQGVTAGIPRPELAPIAVPATAPQSARNWRVEGWGSQSTRAKTGVVVVQPGRGNADARAYADAETATAAHADLLGANTLDVWMNGASYWRNIPEKVWDLHIGGYQVLKKWLSYRDASVINRPLTEEEVAHVQATARRLAAILLLGPELDASFRACAAAHVPLPD